MNTELIAAIRAELARAADPAKAPGMQAYMKSAMPYRGVPSPQMRLVCRAVFAAHPLASFDEWRDTALALWREAQLSRGALRRHCADGRPPLSAPTSGSTRCRSTRR